MFYMMIIYKNRNLYPQNDENGLKSRLYDVIMPPKSLFSGKNFGQHNRLCHFFQFLGYQGQNLKKQPFWVLFPYSPLYKCLDRRFFTFAVMAQCSTPGANFFIFFPNSPWYPKTFRPKPRPDPPPKILLEINFKIRSFRGCNRTVSYVHCVIILFSHSAKPCL